MNAYTLIKKEIISEPFKTPNLRAVLSFGSLDGDVRFVAVVPAADAESIQTGTRWTFDMKPEAPAAPAAPTTDQPTTTE